MILALGHSAGVGKDTFAMFLVDYLRAKGYKNLSIQREGFATRLYEIAHIMYGWAGFKTRQYYDQFPKEKDAVLLNGQKPWQILEGLSGPLNGYDPDMFYNAVAKTKGHHLKIVPDLRRPTEFDKLLADGAYCLRIQKPGTVSNRTMCHLLNGEERWHKTIINDAGLPELRAKAVEFADEVVIPKVTKYLHGQEKP